LAWGSPPACSRAGGLIRAAAVALVAAVALLALTATAQAAFPGTNGKIAFDSQRDPGFNFDIYSMNSDGSGQTSLTSDPEDDLAPAWSPDGQKIAFYSFRDGAAEVWVMNGDGSGETALTTQATAPDSEPAWSPTGQKIAFVSGRNGNDEIYSMNADGSGQTRLTNNSAVEEDPAWSPDGSKIAFVSDRDGNREIYSMNADGSGQTRLTANTDDDYAPNWSPNGLQLTFTSYRDGNSEIYKMSAAGGAQTRLTFNTDADEQPVFSPDGTRIAFETQRDGCCTPEIYSMLSSSGSGATNLTQGPGDDGNPDWQPVQSGSIVVKAASQPSDPQDFSFTAAGGLSPTSFTLDDDLDPALSNTQTFAGVPPHGGYSVAESVPSGWDLQSATCDDGSPITNIDVSPGETVTCTFTNLKRGSVVIVDDSIPNDAQNFSFTAAGGLSPTSFSLDDDSDPTLSNTRTFANVVPAAGYSVAETVPTGWDLQSATCDNGSAVSNITVSAGQTVTCTFTNRKRGSVVIVDDSQPNDAQDFSFTAAGGLSPTSFQLDDDSDPVLSNTRTFTNVIPGAGYSVSETVPSGWDQTGATCDNGSAVSNITVAAGQTVTCTFTNRKRGQIVVVKDAQPNDPQDFAFTAGGGLSPSSFSLDDDSDPTLSNTRTFSNVVPTGGYSLSETVPSGWDQSSATCDNGSPVSNINVAAGQTVTCTFVNTAAAPTGGTIVLAEDSQPNDPQDFSFTTGGGLSPSSLALDDDSDPTLPSTQTFADIPVGSGYSLSEAVPSGWKKAAASCDDGSPVDNIDVADGETVTCTFVNAKVFHDTPASASTLSVPLVPEFRQTISATQCQARGGLPSNHEPPFALTSCNPPAFPNGIQAHLGAQATGMAQLTVIPGDLTTPADEADVSLAANLTDVHALSGTGADYDPNPAGADVTMLFRLRISDLLNGASPPQSATVTDTTFSTPVDCVSTPDPSLGSDCTASTSANAVLPGSVREGEQAVLAIFRVRLLDSGSNATRGDGDDRDFAMQGYYVP
jgi:Tol biopolymer transport system component